MRRRPNTAPNALEHQRIVRFADIGCIACYLDGHACEPYDVHHLVEGYRLGHRFTIPLCPCQHRGVPQGTAYTLKSPRLFDEKRDFTLRYGTERELLKIVDDLLGYPSPFTEAA